MACAALALAQELPTPRPNPLPRTPPARETPRQSGDQLVRVTATADVSQVTPGQKFHLAFVFDIEPGWHIYWKNPGDAGGGPTEINVSVPPNFQVGKTLWPRPMAFKSDEGVSYGYEDKTVLFVEVTPPPEVLTDEVAFSARLNWMVCKEVCLLGRSSQMLSLPVSSAPAHGPLSPSSPIDPAVAQFKSRLPRPLSDLSGAEAKFDGHTLLVRLPSQGFGAAEFFPIEMPGIQFEQPSIKTENDWITITVAVRVEPQNAMGRRLSVGGTIGLGSRPTDPCYEIDIALPAT